MSINKVIYGDSTLIDLTSDSVTASALMSGVTAHDSSGALITGTIAAKTSADITVAGPTISVPSGAYSSATTKTVASGAYYSQFNLNINQLNIQLNNTTGNININQNASLNTTVIKTTGYIEKEHSVVQFNASVSSSYQLPTIPAATITPTESSQVAAASGKFTIGNITVAAVSSDYIGSNISQRSSSDITVSGPTVAVPSGYYIANNSVTIPQASINSSFVWRVDPSIGFNSTTGVVTADFDQEYETFLVTQSGYADEMTIYLNPYGVSSYQIPVSSSSDITVAGPTVTVPSGYYPAAVSKTIPEAVLETRFDLDLNTLNYSLNSATGNISISGAVGKQTHSVHNKTGSGYADFDNSTIHINTTVSSNYQLPTQAAATITPTESAQTAVASGKYTTGAVTVAAISSDYVGSNIATRSAADLIVNGSKVTAPAGYYSSSASANVASGSLNEYISLPSITPSWSIDSSTGKVSAEYWVAPGISPIATSGYFENDVYVYPIITLDSSYQLSTKSAATYTPSTTAQTIASGQYLTGAQTIAGDTNLIAANIASGVTIFGITGTHQGGITPTGTIAISSNGTYDVTNYANASVNIGATVIEKRLIVPEGMIGV